MTVPRQGEGEGLLQITGRAKPEAPGRVRMEHDPEPNHMRGGRRGGEESQRARSQEARRVKGKSTSVTEMAGYIGKSHWENGSPAWSLGWRSLGEEAWHTS